MQILKMLVLFLSVAIYLPKTDKIAKKASSLDNFNSIAAFIEIFERDSIKKKATQIYAAFMQKGK